MNQKAAALRESILKLENGEALWTSLFNCAIDLIKKKCDLAIAKDSKEKKDAALSAQEKYRKAIKNIKKNGINFVISEFDFMRT